VTTTYEDVPVAVPEGHYAANVECRNCRQRQKVAAPVGTLLEFALRGVKCASCGCAELQKEARRP
jgi:hypothetical protein